MKFAWPVSVGVMMTLPLLLFRALPVLGYLTGGALLLGAIAFADDRWAGAFALYMVARWLFPMAPFGFERSMMIALGVLFLVSARQIPRRWEDTVRWIIVLLGAVQVFQVGFQFFGIDPLFAHFHRVLGPPSNRVIGTLGNSNFAGAYLAISSAVVPGLLLPLWGMAILATKSLLAALAFAFCLLIRYRKNWKLFSVVIAAGLAGAVLVHGIRGEETNGWKFRAAIWGAALREVEHHPLFGLGPGSWIRHAPVVNIEKGSREIFAQAHNEFVEVSFEGGLIGLSLVLLWMFEHRGSFLSGPWGPALGAIFVESLAMFPFQVPAVAVLSLLMMGLATRPAQEVCR